MRFNLEIPWEKYALIAELVRRFDTQGLTLGKTALQKMIFLLERVFGFDFDYSYTLYAYGPFCADVARDLDIVEGFGGVEITYNSSYGGYEPRPGPAIDELLRRGGEWTPEISAVLDRLVADYGRATAKELELRSTIIYLASSARTSDELVRMVHQAKPHFSEAQIEAARRELEEKGYLANAVALGGWSAANN